MYKNIFQVFTFYFYNVTPNGKAFVKLNPDYTKPFFFVCVSTWSH